MVGEYEKAIGIMEHPLPYFGLRSLRLDPLRDHPRFQALISKYGEE